MTKEILFDVIKGTTRQVDFMEMINTQYQHLRQAKNQAGSKPTKVQAAYIEEQEQKLVELQDIVKRWIWKAFEEDEEIYNKSDYWSKVEKNFNIKVFVELKDKE